MDNREVAIQLSGVKKMYKLGQIGGGTLKADLQSWWAKRRGKEDPNTKIGEQRLIGQTFMALNGIDLTVYKGEALGIIGGNGAGKSTLLKLLSQVTAPTAGRIDLYGRVASMLEVGTGFNGEMTGRENIYMNGAILGMTKAEIDAKMEDIIEFSEVRDFIDTPVKRYSSGMYVKLAFSVAAHLDSEIMIMDEVLAVGDMAFQKKCLDKMRDVAKKEGRTVLYVSHNMNTIRQLCDRCVVLKSGRLIFDGDVEKAIRIYSGGSEEVAYINDVIITKEMHETPIEHGLEFVKIVCDAEDGIVKYGGKVKFDFVIKNHNQTQRKVLLRMMVNSQNGTVVTMSQTEQQIIVPSSAEGFQKSVMLNLERIVPGSYSISFVLYEVYCNTDRNLDVIRDLFRIAIIAPPTFNHGVEWNPNWWGYVTNGYLEDIQ